MSQISGQLHGYCPSLDIVHVPFTDIRRHRRRHPPQHLALTDLSMILQSQLRPATRQLRQHLVHWEEVRAKRNRRNPGFPSRRKNLSAKL